MDAYGEPLAEGECVDRSKVTAQEQRGLLQGLATAAGGLLSTSSSTGNRSQVQRWGYFNEILMTEAEAQLRAGTTALKFVMKESTVDVRWRVRSFNLEGRTDGKNLRAVLTNLCPRRVILVHGSQEAYQDLKRHANKMGTEVMAPSSLLTEAESDSTPSANVIELDFDTKVLDVGLEEEEGAFGRYAPQGGGKGALISMKEMGHYSLGLVKAVASDVLDADGQPFIRCIPTSGQPRQPMLLADGELLLTDTSQKQSIRQKLREAGVSPELTIGAEGAALVCDGKVMVRVRENKVVLEGPLSETYFKVRAVLYSRFVAL